MKIGVVTYTHCYNQGADLQAFALTHVLKAMGHDAEVVWFDRVPVGKLQKRKIFYRALLGRFRRNPVKGVIDIAFLVKRTFFSRKKQRVSTMACAECTQAYDEFWDQMIPHSMKVDIEDLRMLSYDCYVAGSDQIWNWRLTGDMSPYFLLFAQTEALKISYAASVSVEKIDAEFVDLYRRGLANLNAVSVRETEGADVLRHLTDKPVEVVLDPTLLLREDEWRTVESSRITYTSPYVFSYTLNSSKSYLRMMLQYAKQKGLRILNVSPVPSIVRNPLIVDVCNAGPREFLWLLSRAACVFTNSFHGTVFSINYHKPFFSLLNPYSSTNSRVLSITRQLSLQDRVFMDDRVRVQDLVSSGDIDYVAVDLKLEALRQSSMDFLKRAIHG